MNRVVSIVSYDGINIYKISAKDVSNCESVASTRYSLCNTNRGEFPFKIGIYRL